MAFAEGLVSVAFAEALVSVVFAEALVSVVLAEVLVPGVFRVLNRLLLPFHANLADSAAQREAGSVGELPGLVSLHMSGHITRNGYNLQTIKIYYPYGSVGAVSGLLGFSIPAKLAH